MHKVDYTTRFLSNSFRLVNNDGTAYGTTWTTGKLGGALDFGGHLLGQVVPFADVALQVIQLGAILNQVLDQLVAPSADSAI